MAKDTCEQYRQLTIQDMKKFYFLSGSRSGSITWTNRWGDKNSISIDTKYDQNNRPRYHRLHYKLFRDEGDKRMDYIVMLDSTKCYFGDGERWWFLCPRVGCSKRVGVLYLSQGVFTCRHCLDLKYDSQYEYHGSGSEGLQVLSRIWKAQDDMTKLRVKYWKGSPTKRYMKLIKRSRAISNSDLLALEHSLSK